MIPALSPTYFSSSEKKYGWTTTLNKGFNNHALEINEPLDVFCVAILIGIVIGYTAKPQFTVNAYNPSVSVPSVKDLPEDLLGQCQNSGVDSSEYTEESEKVMQGMKPLVKAGPFHIAWNPDTDDYWITLREGNQTLVTQMTIENRTELSFIARKGERNITFYYDKNSGNLDSVIFTISHVDNEGIPDMLHSYLDTNGDGKFEWIRNHHADVSYKIKELQCNDDPQVK